MSDNAFTADKSAEVERTLGQSIAYWALVYVIAIPALFVVIGFVVSTTLKAFN